MYTEADVHTQCSWCENPVLEPVRAQQRSTSLTHVTLMIEEGDLGKAEDPRKLAVLEDE